VSDWRPYEPCREPGGGEVRYRSIPGGYRVLFRGEDIGSIRKMAPDRYEVFSPGYLRPFTGWFSLDAATELLLKRST